MACSLQNASIIRKRANLKERSVTRSSFSSTGQQKGALWVHNRRLDHLNDTYQGKRSLAQSIIGAPPGADSDQVTNHPLTLNATLAISHHWRRSTSLELRPLRFTDEQ